MQPTSSNSQHRRLDVWLSTDPIASNDIDEVKSVALDLHRRGNIEIAKQLYQKILEQQSDHPIALHYLGVVAFQTGDLELAENLIRQALEIEPSDYKALTNLGNVYRSLGAMTQAAEKYRASLKLSPNHPDTAQNLGVILVEQGKFGEAVEILEVAVAKNPENVDLCCTLASTQLELGEHQKALVLSRDCSDRNLRHPAPLRLLTRLLPQLSENMDEDDIETIIIRCFYHPTVESSSLRGLAQRKLINQWPRFDDISDKDNGLYSNSLFLAFLENEFVTHPELERLITILRHQLLKIATELVPGKRIDTSLVPMSVALACQSHLNDFIFQESSAETIMINGLVQKFTNDLKTTASVDIAVMAIISTYRPLSTQAFATNLQSRLDSNQDKQVAKLIKWQLTDWIIEQKLKAELPQIGSIDGVITGAVRSQYEESPYPRWHKINNIDPNPFYNVMSTQIPALKHRSLTWSSKPSILIAGCGTGQHPISTAVTVANADILAIDLSQSSLAYAKRMSVEYEINNIRFAQTDLLTLGDYGEQFDMIECSGVLHHLEDPIAGWRVLTGLLKSEGFMKIAVYSEVARQHVVAARELIQKGELPVTAEGIRACRALIKNLPAKHPARGVIQFEDFFAMPHCRDLLFHVQEHRFTIPLIQTVLKELKLEFLGFTFGGQPIGKITRNPAMLDNNLPAATSLADWHNHELNNPDIFSGMYQFWVFKS